MGLRWLAGDDSLAIKPVRGRWLASQALDWCRSWSMTPGIRRAMMRAYSAWHDSGGSRAAKPMPPPPGATPPGNPPGNLTVRWAARSRVAPANAPPDGDNGTLHPAASIIDLPTMLCRQAMQQTTMVQHDRNITGGKEEDEPCCCCCYCSGKG